MTCKDSKSKSYKGGVTDDRLRDCKSRFTTDSHFIFRFIRSYTVRGKTREMYLIE